MEFKIRGVGRSVWNYWDNKIYKRRSMPKKKYKENPHFQGAKSYLIKEDIKTITERIKTLAI